MEAVLWYVFTGTRGGPNRARILRAVERRPRNTNQIADVLDLDYKTVQHHLDVLLENDVVQHSGDDYGAVFLPSQRVRNNWETVESIFSQMDDLDEAEPPAEPNDSAGSVDRDRDSDEFTEERR